MLTGVRAAPGPHPALPAPRARQRPRAPCGPAARPLPAAAECRRFPRIRGPSAVRRSLPAGRWGRTGRPHPPNPLDSPRGGATQAGWRPDADNRVPCVRQPHPAADPGPRGPRAHQHLPPHARRGRPPGPLELVRCSPEGCGLVQLRHTADHTAIHGDRYEYRSGVRPYMVGHLRDRARAAAALVDFEPGDLVVDIGSNDGTLLRNFAPGRPTLVGIAPPPARSGARTTRRTSTGAALDLPRRVRGARDVLPGGRRKDDLPAPDPRHHLSPTPTRRAPGVLPTVPPRSAGPHGPPRREEKST